MRPWFIPPMIAHPKPETVFIAGGGEGATLREVLAHKTVKRVVMVDIDKKVPQICQKYLPSLSQGAFDDSRVELLYMDALKYVAETKEKFDVMILDLTEPLEEGPAYLLFAKEFYQDLSKKLKKGGIMSLQAGATSVMYPVHISGGGKYFAGGVFRGCSLPGGDSFLRRPLGVRCGLANS